MTRAASPRHARRVSENLGSGCSPDDKVDPTSKPFGGGPFKLDEWVRASPLAMSKNPDSKATLVYLDKRTYQVQGNEQQRIDSFGTGATDAFHTATPGSIESTLKAVKGAYKATVDVTMGQTFVVNTTKAPLDDVRIRKAIVTAIPRGILAEEILDKTAPAPHFSVPGTPWRAEGSKLPAYDVAAAQKLIDEYVAEEGVPVRFTMLAFQQTLDQHLPFCPYTVNQVSVVCSPKLGGCEQYEDGILRADKLWKKA